MSKFTKLFNQIYVGNQVPQDSYWLVRNLIIRTLGLLYFNIFLILINQGIPLLGVNGLLPIYKFSQYLKSIKDGNLNAFLVNPSIFQYFSDDITIQIIGWSGLTVSIFLILGFANFPILFILWCFQLSIVNSGQLFYGYGWETQILEYTFLCFFLVPVWRIKLNDLGSPPKKIAIFFLRWLMFRMMFGAGMIKLRGDECWSNLTCLLYHYETQPNPHPLSWFFHNFPVWFHKAGIVFNHFVEVIVPYGVFGPRIIRLTAGVIFIIYQIVIIFTGNFAWINWITLFMAIPLFDDYFIKSVFKKFKSNTIPSFKIAPSKITQVTLVIFSIAVIYLSINPVMNLLSNEQIMNTSYTRLHLINTYGVFGSIGKKRYEIVIKGSNYENPIEERDWKEYEFKCKPGKLDRIPCFIGPYHLRLDWQIWFSAMRPKISERWLYNFSIALLENNKDILSLIEYNPFPKKAPKWIKIDRYIYQFTKYGEKNWLKRKKISNYLDPIRLK